MPSHEASAATIGAALQRVLPGYALAPSPFSHRLLGGGLNTRTYVVTVGAREYALRLAAGGGTPLLDVVTEARTMQAVARAGLAPRVVGVDPSRGALLTEFRAGATPWTAARARESTNIIRAAALLRRLHVVPATLPRFEAERVAERYIAAIDDRLPTSGIRADELLQLARVYDRTYAADVLCHNDLFASNILDDGKLMLVDFEYAVRAAPILDLASLAGMNAFAAREREALLEAYYRGRPPVTPGEFADVVRMVRLLGLFWAVHGARRAADAAAYSDLIDRLSETFG